MVLVGIEQLWSNPFLIFQTLFFWLERAEFCWDFLICPCWEFWVIGSFSSKSRVYEEKKMQITYPVLFFGC